MTTVTNEAGMCRNVIDSGLVAKMYLNTNLGIGFGTRIGRLESFPGQDGAWATDA
jgi:hypothetical protein